MIKIRKATKADAKAIVEINVSTWKHSYKGMLPDEVLANRNVSDERISKVEHNITTGASTYFIAQVNNEVVGFCCGGKARDANYPFKYEIRAIYVSPSSQNKGVGRALLNEFKSEINNAPFYLYTLKQNIRAHNFYKNNGGTMLPGFDKTLIQNNTQIEEVLFAFNY